MSQESGSGYFGVNRLELEVLQKQPGSNCGRYVALLLKERDNGVVVCCKIGAGMCIAAR